MNTLILVLATALLAQAATTPPPTAADPIPGLEGKPGTVAAKSKHDTAKNAIGNVRAEVSDPIPGVPPTPTGSGKATAKPPACVATADKPCPPATAK